MHPENVRLLETLTRELDAKGAARALLRMLERRGFAVSTEQRERVLACTDLATLDEWLDRAARAESTESVFVDSRARPVGDH
jgi:hypothetical protein